MRRFRRLLLLVAAALTSILVALEVGLRVVSVPAIEIHRRALARAESANFFEYDADLGWRGRAGAHGSLVGWEFTTDVRLNARGFRDLETGPKRPHVFRIVLLGDSIVWGHGVDQTQRYGDLVAEALRRRGMAVETINLAVSGYGTDQELLLWEREGGRYCADLVLLGLYENDVRENTLAAQGPYPKPYFRPSSDGVLMLQNVPVPRVPDLPPAPPARGPRVWLQRHLRVGAALAFVRQAFRRPDASATARPEAPPGGVDLTAVLVGRLAASVGRDGSAFAVVVLPDVHDSPTTREAATRSGVSPVLDLAAPFRRTASGGRPLFYRFDGAHWTALGHAVAAESIAWWIASAALLPPSPRTCAERP
jgi:lysophospholipase L1-like esterase